MCITAPVFLKWYTVYTFVPACILHSLDTDLTYTVGSHADTKHNLSAGCCCNDGPCVDLPCSKPGQPGTGQGPWGPHYWPQLVLHGSGGQPDGQPQCI